MKNPFYSKDGFGVSESLVKESESIYIHELFDTITEEVNRIISSFMGKREFFKSISILGGESGTALLYAQLYLITGDKIYLKKLREILDFLINNINTSTDRNTVSPFFSSGLAGFGWLLCYMNDNKVLKIPEAFFTQIDKVLLSFVEQLQNIPWDILHGRLSISRYFMRRNLPEQVETSLRYLENIGRTVGDQILWEAENENYIKDFGKHYDCGYAHGMAGILYFVSKAYKHDISRKLCLKLANGIINFYAHNEQDVNLYGCYYPYRVLAGEKEAENNTFSRLAWCYGDLTVLYSLYYYYYTIDDAAQMSIVLNKLKKTVNRTDCEQNGVNDSMICHGSAGIAHIYNRLFYMTDIIEFKKASLYWLNVTANLELKQEGNRCFGLLEGTLGVGLVILSFFDSSHMDWDEVIMLA